MFELGYPLKYACSHVGLRGGWGLRMTKQKKTHMMNPEDKKPNKNKRLHSEDSDDTEGENISPRPSLNFPRFLVLKSKEENFKMTSISPFVISKTIKSMAGEPKSVKKLRSGDLLVEVEKASYSNNLLKITSFYNHACECVPHGSLNTSRGVIRCPDLAGVSEAEIVAELTSQFVSGARRIKIKRNGQEIQTNTIILTFSVPFLPSFLNIGYLRTKVSTYIPNPLQCYNCFKFGHNEKTCKVAAVCPKCSTNGYTHDEDKCTRPMSCVNCGEPHSARSRDCKTWKVEREVLRVKYTQNIGFPEARQIAKLAFMSPSSSSSYSSITKSNSNKSTVCTDASTQTELPQDVTSNKPKVPEKPSQSQPRRNAASQSAASPAIQNVPKYSSTKQNSQSSKPNTNIRGVSQTPRQKIDLKNEGYGKGSNDPLQTHNRFSELDRLSVEDDDVDDPPRCPPPSFNTTKENKIKRVQPPESMQH